jgi:hypothetical protein
MSVLRARLHCKVVHVDPTKKTAPCQVRARQCVRVRND